MKWDARQVVQIGKEGLESGRKTSDCMKTRGKNKESSAK